MHSKRWSGVVTVVALGFVACVTDPVPDDAGPGVDAGVDAGPTFPTLSSIQGTVFNLTCATSGCHTGAGVMAANNLDLTAGASYANLVGDAGTGVPSTLQPTVLRVDPGNPDASFLITKLTAPSCCFSSGGTCNDCVSWEQAGTGDGNGIYMPEVGSQLSSQQLQAIEDWISMGAQNN